MATHASIAFKTSCGDAVVVSPVCETSDVGERCASGSDTVADGKDPDGTDSLRRCIFRSCILRHCILTFYSCDKQQGEKKPQRSRHAGRRHVASRYFLVPGTADLEIAPPNRHLLLGRGNIDDDDDDNICGLVGAERWDADEG